MVETVGHQKFVVDGGIHVGALVLVGPKEDRQRRVVPIRNDRLWSHPCRIELPFPFGLTARAGTTKAHTAVAAGLILVGHKGGGHLHSRPLTQAGYNVIRRGIPLAACLFGNSTRVTLRRGIESPGGKRRAGGANAAREKTTRLWRQHEMTDGGAARRLPEDGDLIGVATKSSNVSVNPLQGSYHV